MNISMYIRRPWLKNLRFAHFLPKGSSVAPSLKETRFFTLMALQLKIVEKLNMFSIFLVRRGQKAVDAAKFIKRSLKCEK
ncbi:hypothetical protein P175DRAFT_0496909 [Aspergillus ochraceoroseus IBT 24754]|uniref:Uncharacterized protein n=1 Tax=Aspergillus ochraceoroseus IBT 24754 TaxID=1392256 RepID=A0A2T5M5G9_9EURO|nr:uncharacterized protein P175DRAFT_0496909 [Aspergillus ochraceoroseus IBT 24754]PTU23775.1 hypothetical protein P175DRAFT_0496909 [Aspergillus ochraceoroseus IBT 24754]